VLLYAITTAPVQVESVSKLYINVKELLKYKKIKKWNLQHLQLVGVVLEKILNMLWQK
jgi:hypothetical protein